MSVTSSDRRKRILADVRNSPLNLVKAVRPSKRINVNVDVFYLLNDRFSRSLALEWNGFRVQEGQILINSDDLVKTNSLCDAERGLSSLLLRHLFHYLPQMLKDDKWRLIMHREVNFIMDSRWVTVSRRLTRVVFLTRFYFLVDFYTKWTLGELNLDEEKFRYSMAGQGYQDILGNTRLELGVYSYQNYMNENLGFPADSCFSHIARSVVFAIQDTITRPAQLATMDHFKRLDNHVVRNIFKYLPGADLLSVRLASKRCHQVATTLMRGVCQISITKIKSRVIEFFDTEQTISQNIGVPQYRWHPSTKARLSYDSFVNLATLLELDKMFHPLDDNVIKIFNICKFETMKLQVSNFSEFSASTLLFDAPHLKIIKMAFVATLTDSDWDALRILVSVSNFTFHEEENFKVTLIRKPLQSPTEVAPKRRRLARSK